MSKRQIMSAAKRLGVDIKHADYGWEPTPGESVPCWSITLTEDCADKFGVDGFVQLDNTFQVTEWLESLEPFQADGGEA